MRAEVKGAIQAGFGWMPGGPQLYRYLTRHVMGTQSTHVDKLAHVWPEYAEQWIKHGIDLDGKTIWMHGGGWTLYPCLLSYLLTGKGCVLTVWESGADEQYSDKSFDFAQEQQFGSIAIPDERRDFLRSLKGKRVEEVLEATVGQIERTSRVRPALESNSVDLLVTGGILEHFRPNELTEFLAHAQRIVKPDGWCSHVIDLRDHLYHADKSIPFLNHLRLSRLAYQVQFGHRLGYHNRKPPQQIRSLIENAGFRVEAERRLLLPDKKWAETAEDFQEALVGLERSRLHPDFATLTDEDLRSAAVHFMARRT